MAASGNIMNGNINLFSRVTVEMNICNIFMSNYKIISLLQYAAIKCVTFFEM